MKLMSILCLCLLVVLADACGGRCLLVEVDLPPDSVATPAIEVSFATVSADSVVNGGRRR
jgi:hypothetical protein